MPNLLSNLKVPFGSGPAKRPVDKGFPTDRLKFATNPVQKQAEAAIIEPMSEQAPFVDQEFKEHPQRSLLEIAYMSAACLSVAVIGIYMIMRPAAHEQNLAGWADTTISTAADPAANGATMIDGALPAGKQPAQNQIESDGPQIDNLFDLSDTGISKTSSAVMTPAVAPDGDQAALATGTGLVWSQYAVNSTATGKSGSGAPAN